MAPLETAPSPTAVHSAAFFARIRISPGSAQRAKSPSATRTRTGSHAISTRGSAAASPSGAQARRRSTALSGGRRDQARTRQRPFVGGFSEPSLDLDAPESARRAPGVLAARHRAVGPSAPSTYVWRKYMEDRLAARRRSGGDEREDRAVLASGLKTRRRTVAARPAWPFDVRGQAVCGPADVRARARPTESRSSALAAPSGRGRHASAFRLAPADRTGQVPAIRSASAPSGAARTRPSGSNGKKPRVSPVGADRQRRGPCAVAPDEKASRGEPRRAAALRTTADEFRRAACARPRRPQSGRRLAPIRIGGRSSRRRAARRGRVRGRPLREAARSAALSAAVSSRNVSS